MEMNRIKCEDSAHCAYFHLSHPNTRPVYWENVFAVDDVMKSHPRCDVVAFIDSDAVLTRDDANVFVARMGDKDFLGSNDPAGLLDRKPFNAGVWAVRNNESGRQIMHEWKESYRPERWESTEAGWECKEQCKWAGPSYEQGAFEDVLQRHKEDVEMTSWTQLNNKLCGTPLSAFTSPDVCHFMGIFKSTIPRYLAKLPRQR